MRNINPDEIELTNPSQSFEYERLSREIDECDDVEVLQQMCKFLVKLEMKQRATYSVILQDTLPELANLGSTDGN